MQQKQWKNWNFSKYVLVNIIILTKLLIRRIHKIIVSHIMTSKWPLVILRKLGMSAKNIFSLLLNSLCNYKMLWVVESTWVLSPMPILVLQQPEEKWSWEINESALKSYVARTKLFIPSTFPLWTKKQKVLPSFISDHWAPRLWLFSQSTQPHYQC